MAQAVAIKVWALVKLLPSRNGSRIEPWTQNGISPGSELIPKVL